MDIFICSNSAPLDLLGRNLLIWKVLAVDKGSLIKIPFKLRKTRFFIYPTHIGKIACFCQKINWKLKDKSAHNMHLDLQGSSAVDELLKLKPKHILETNKPLLTCVAKITTPQRQTHLCPVWTKSNSKCKQCSLRFVEKHNSRKQIYNMYILQEMDVRELMCVWLYAISEHIFGCITSKFPLLQQSYKNSID